MAGKAERASVTMTGKQKPKRDYGDGSIYRRESDGRWVGSLRMEDGTRKYVYGQDRPEAKKKLEALKKKVEQGMLVDSSKQTLSAYLDYWLTTIARSVEPTTLENYRDSLQRVRKALGHLQLQKLKRDHIQQFINGLAGELATSTIRQSYVTLDMALDAAVEWQLLIANPGQNVRLPKLEQAEKPVLTPEQAGHLLRFVAGLPLEPFIVLALGAAMRKGEISALRWQDVDFEKDIIHVNRKVYYLRQPDGHWEMTEGKPKSKASKSTIPMAGFVKEALLRHRKSQLKQRPLGAVAWQNKDLILCNRTGGFLMPSNLDRKFKRLLEAAGLPDIPIHSLRHSCNTLLRLMGVDPVTRQQIMRHARLQETEGTYGHTYDDLKIDAMEKLDRLLSDDDQHFQANS